MIDFTKPHNWIGLLLAVLVIAFVLHQVGQRVATVGRVTAAAGL